MVNQYLKRNLQKLFKIRKIRLYPLWACEDLNFIPIFNEVQIEFSSHYDLSKLQRRKRAIKSVNLKS